MTGRKPAPDDVVIVGQAARLPGVDSLDAWWEGLCAGTEFHRIATDDELLDAGLPERLLDDPNLVRRRPVLEHADYFDPEFFGFSPREAAACDPQQRLFLEVCWELFEHAGHDPREAGPTCGVFAGAGPTTYLPAMGSAYEPATHFDSVVSNERDFIAPRVAYKLGLQGPAISIVSGCATSLVAIHLAVQSLQNYETDMAIAGGSTVFFPQNAGYLYNPHGITSPDGRCRPFSASARGTVTGDAVGAVLLRRREDAEADGDTILGVILGTAVTNDGSDKIGFSAPSIEGQVRAISEALAVAGVPASSIGYVETHGTATKIGDAIEVQALNRALASAPAGSCFLGALKPNIGHTDTAAGITGLIKVLHAFEREQLPPVAGFDSPNPQIDFTGPCRVTIELTPWPRSAEPRRAGVSAFSVGGTNAHIILEEPPGQERDVSVEPVCAESITLRFSAHTNTALAATVEKFADWLEYRATSGLPTPSPQEAAFTLAARRAQLPRRLLVHVATGQDFASACREAARSASTDGSSRPTVFMFSGQGSQYPSMARELLRTSETFARIVDRCQTVFSNHGLDVLEILAGSSCSDDERRRALNRTELAQPALFAVETGLASMLAEWGVIPDAVVGHSIGEYSAAVVAGCIGLEDAAEAVALRGKLVAASPVGALAAATAAADRVEKILAAVSLPVDIAALNGPCQSVITGAVDDVVAAVAALTQRGIRVTRLAGDRAFHSRLLDHAAAELSERLSEYVWHRPTIPMIWASDGTWLQEAPTSRMWADQLRRTVRFSQAIETGRALFDQARWLEVGPGHVLADLVSMNAPDSVTASLIAPELNHSASAIADRAWAQGIADAHLEQATRRVPMPGVVMQRRLLTTRTSTKDSTTLDKTDSKASHRRTSTTTEPDKPPAKLRGDPLSVVRQVWSEEFGISGAADNTDFFADGGDSLVAARISARLGQLFPIDIGPGHVMQDPCTPAGLADRVTTLVAERVATMSDDEVAALLGTGQGTRVAGDHKQLTLSPEEPT